MGQLVPCATTRPSKACSDSFFLDGVCITVHSSDTCRNGRTGPFLDLVVVFWFVVAHQFGCRLGEVAS